MALVLLVATAPMGCKSETEKKAENVQDAYKDVVDAREEGDPDVAKKQAELDTARQEYRDLAKDTLR
ncbi:hypothetical protein GCM10027275_53160 [Rhabdobacter roseus]